jgi:hypothetical protein
LLLDEPELPELPDDPDDPDDPDEPDEALRPVCPLLLEPDMPPELPELLEPDIPPEFSLPEDPTFRFRSCDEVDELPLTPLERSEEELLDALRAFPCEPDDDPALPPTLPVLEPLDEAWRSRSDAECPSPCDELPRSRFELPDEALLLLWSLFDEPEVFRSRSAIS